MGEMLGLHLDHKRGGTHYSDRMHRILGVCHACGILWHEEKVSYRNGASEVQRVEDVRAQGSVLVTAQYEKYGLHVNPRVLPRLRGMAEQFAYALNVPAVSVEIDGDVVYVRVPRERREGEGVVLFEQAWALAPGIAKGHLLLGVDEEQNQLLLDLASASNVHCAVIGMTGSGKSTLMKTMILSAEMAGGAAVALFDPSGGFRALSGHPAVWRSGLFRRAEECEWGLEVLARSLGREGRGEGASCTYVFVDEVPELVRQRPAIKEHLGRLAQAGRHGGLHLILGAQHPLASELGSATLRNIPVRLVGRVADRAAAYNATGRSDSGVEHLRGGGDFLALNGSSKRHFQAAMPSAQLLEQWAQRYPPRSPRLPPRPSAQPLQRPAREVQGWPLSAESASVGGEERGPGGAGHDLDDIPGAVVEAITHYITHEGKLPSPYWVRRYTRETVPTGGFYPPKARRAIEEAAQRLGMPLPEGEEHMVEG
jgi:hypothetical protein